MWTLKRLGSIFGAQLAVLGAIAAYDQFADGLVRLWLGGYGVQLSHVIAGYFILPASFFLVFVVPTRILLMRHRNWQRWGQTFRYAGLAGDVDLARILPRYQMDLPYVALERRIRRLQTMGRPVMVDLPFADDATTDLTALTSSRHWRSTRYGFVLSGAATVGKTRFVTEWLRYNHPTSWVIMPRHDHLPMPHPRLKAYRRGGVLLFLDDLDGYGRIVDRVLEFLRSLDTWGIPCMIVATVRDSGPWQRVQSEHTFTPLLNRLDCLGLPLLTDEQMEAVGAELGKPPPPQNREHTFSWLLDVQFREMRRRFDRELSQHDRSLLRAARLLDTCGIPITRERWLSVAKELFQFQRGAMSEAEAMSSLRIHGFLAGESPDPSYLKNAVWEEIEECVLAPRLHEYLKRSKDGSALLDWGVHLVSHAVRLDAAPAYLTDAGSILREDDSLQSHEHAILASLLLGRSLIAIGQVTEGHRAWREAIEVAKNSDATTLKEVGAQVALELGYSLWDMDRPEEAEQAWRDAASLAMVSDNESGATLAAMAGVNLINILHRSGRPHEAKQIRDAVKDFGRRVDASLVERVLNEADGTAFWRMGDLERKAYRDTPEWGSPVSEETESPIMTWEPTVAGLLLKTLESCVAGDLVEANTIRECMMGIANKTGEPQDLAWCARATLALGDQLSRLGDAEEAKRALREAIALGKKSSLPGGLADAALAALALGNHLSHLGEAEEAKRAWREAITLGKRIDIPQAGDIVARASSKEGSQLMMEGKSYDAATALQEALAFGGWSNDAAAQSAAACAALLFADLLIDSGREEEATWALKQSVHLGSISKHPRGEADAAAAALCLGAIVTAKGEIEAGIEIWRDAASLGRDSDTPDGMLSAVWASLALSKVLQARGRSDESERVLRNMREIIDVLEKSEDRTCAELAREAVREAEEEDQKEGCP